MISSIIGHLGLFRKSASWALALACIAALLATGLSADSRTVSSDGFLYSDYLRDNLRQSALSGDSAVRADNFVVSTERGIFSHERARIAAAAKAEADKFVSGKWALSHYISTGLSSDLGDLGALSQSRIRSSGRALVEFASDESINALTGGLQTFSFVHNAELDLRLPLGKRPGYVGVSFLGALRQGLTDATLWELHAYGGEDEAVGSNLGLIYRREMEDTLVGLNSFIDYETRYDEGFLRWSIGGEVRSDWVDAFGNYYLALTDSKVRHGTRNSEVIYSANGFDVEFNIHSPQYPWLIGKVGYFLWTGESGAADENGVRLGLKFAPVQFPAAIEIEYEDGDDGQDVGGRILFEHKFGESPPRGLGGLTTYDPKDHMFARTNREHVQRIYRVTIAVTGGGSDDDGDGGGGDDGVNCEDEANAELEECRDGGGDGDNTSSTVPANLVIQSANAAVVVSVMADASADSASASAETADASANQLAEISAGERVTLQPSQLPMTITAYQSARVESEGIADIAYVRGDVMETAVNIGNTSDRVSLRGIFSAFEGFLNEQIGDAGSTVVFYPSQMDLLYGETSVESNVSFVSEISVNDANNSIVTVMIDGSGGFYVQRMDNGVANVQSLSNQGNLALFMNNSLLECDDGFGGNFGGLVMLSCGSGLNFARVDAYPHELDINGNRADIRYVHQAVSGVTLMTGVNNPFAQIEIEGEGAYEYEWTNSTVVSPVELVYPERQLLQDNTTPFDLDDPDDNKIPEGVTLTVIITTSVQIRDAAGSVTVVLATLSVFGGTITANLPNVAWLVLDENTGFMHLNSAFKHFENLSVAAATVSVNVNRNGRVVQGDVYTVQFESSGTPDPLSYEWRRNGVSLTIGSSANPLTLTGASSGRTKVADLIIRGGVARYNYNVAVNDGSLLFDNGAVYLPGGAAALGRHTIELSVTDSPRLGDAMVLSSISLVVEVNSLESNNLSGVRVNPLISEMYQHYNDGNAYVIHASDVVASAPIFSLEGYGASGSGDYVYNTEGAANGLTVTEAGEVSFVADVSENATLSIGVRVTNSDDSAYEQLLNLRVLVGALSVSPNPAAVTMDFDTEYAYNQSGGNISVAVLSNSGNIGAVNYEVLNCEGDTDECSFSSQNYSALYAIALTAFDGINTVGLLERNINPLQNARDERQAGIITLQVLAYDDLVSVTSDIVIDVTLSEGGFQFGEGQTFVVNSALFTEGTGTEANPYKALPPYTGIDPTNPISVGVISNADSVSLFLLTREVPLFSTPVLDTGTGEYSRVTLIEGVTVTTHNNLTIDDATGELNVIMDNGLSVYSGIVAVGRVGDISAQIPLYFEFSGIPVSTALLPAAMSLGVTQDNDLYRIPNDYAGGEFLTVSAPGADGITFNALDSSISAEIDDGIISLGAAANLPNGELFTIVLNAMIGTGDTAFVSNHTIYFFKSTTTAEEVAADDGNIDLELYNVVLATITEDGKEKEVYVPSTKIEGDRISLPSGFDPIIANISVVGATLGNVFTVTSTSGDDRTVTSKINAYEFVTENGGIFALGELGEIILFADSLSEAATYGITLSISGDGIGAVNAETNLFEGSSSAVLLTLFVEVAADANAAAATPLALRTPDSIGFELSYSQLARGDSLGVHVPDLDESAIQTRTVVLTDNVFNIERTSSQEIGLTRGDPITVEYQVFSRSQQPVIRNFYEDGIYILGEDNLYIGRAMSSLTTSMETVLTDVFNSGRDDDSRVETLGGVILPSGGSGDYRYAITDCSASADVCNNIKVMPSEYNLGEGDTASTVSFGNLRIDSGISDTRQNYTVSFKVVVTDLEYAELEPVTVDVNIGVIEDLQISYSAPNAALLDSGYEVERVSLSDVNVNAMIMTTYGSFSGNSHYTEQTYVRTTITTNVYGKVAFPISTNIITTLDVVGGVGGAQLAVLDNPYARITRDGILLLKPRDITRDGGFPDSFAVTVIARDANGNSPLVESNGAQRGLVSYLVFDVQTSEYSQLDVVGLALSDSITLSSSKERDFTDADDDRARSALFLGLPTGRGVPAAGGEPFDPEVVRSTVIRYSVDEVDLSAVLRECPPEFCGNVEGLYLAFARYTENARFASFVIPSDDADNVPVSGAVIGTIAITNGFAPYQYEISSSESARYFSINTVGVITYADPLPNGAFVLGGNEEYLIETRVTDDTGDTFDSSYNLVWFTTVTVTPPTITLAFDGLSRNGESVGGRVALDSAGDNMFNVSTGIIATVNVESISLGVTVDGIADGLRPRFEIDGGSYRGADGEILTVPVDAFQINATTGVVSFAEGFTPAEGGNVTYQFKVNLTWLLAGSEETITSPVYYVEWSVPGTEYSDLSVAILSGGNTLDYDNSALTVAGLTITASASSGTGFATLSISGGTDPAASYPGFDDFDDATKDQFRSFFPMYESQLFERVTISAVSITVFRNPEIPAIDPDDKTRPVVSDVPVDGVVGLEYSQTDGTGLLSLSSSAASGETYTIGIKITGRDQNGLSVEISRFLAIVVQ